MSQNFTSDTLKSKVVPQIMELSSEFKEKALLFEKNHKRLQKLKSFRSLSFDEKQEKLNLSQDNLKLKLYLKKHIEQFKKNRQEWFFENIEAKKYA